MIPQKYIKKPIYVEAVQVTEGNEKAIAAWCDGFAFADRERVHLDPMRPDLCAHLNDWIIKGVMGEFYKIEDKIFHMTYTCDRMNFSQAIDFVKRGHRLSRRAWCDKGRYIAHVPGTTRNEPYIVYRMPDRNLSPWMPTHEDLLSEDWIMAKWIEPKVIEEKRSCLKREMQRKRRLVRVPGVVYD